MKNHLTVCLLLMLASCSSTPESHYYTLSASTVKSTAQGVHVDWTLSPVTVPDLLNRPQIVLKSGANGVHLLEYDRWAEPFDSMTSRILGDDLTARLGTGSPNPLADSAKKELAVTIDEFGADDSGNVTLAATWTVKTGNMTSKYVFSRTDKSGAGDVNSQVSTMSGLLGKLADAIASQP